MITELAVSARPHEIRLAVLEDNTLVEFHIERMLEPGLVGNIYRGRVMRVLPGMEAAFVDIGLDKAGFLYVTDVLPNIWELEEEFGSIGSGNMDNRIENLLQQGQEVLVQVAREPISTKGPRLTTRITLPGHYLVLLPFFDYIGISRRIEDETERERLKQIVASAKPEGMGFIIRTASEGVEEEKIVYEMGKLIELWQEILEKKKHTPLPGLVHCELDLCLKALRDFLGKDTRRLIVDSPQAYERLKAYAQRFVPHLQYMIELYQGEKPLFETLEIENVIAYALKPRIDLKSGGYIIIEKTEALTVIDVNTGRFVGENNLEETIVKTNLEAVQEIVRQLRLRDLGGIIIIDFIDMRKEEDRQTVLTALVEALKRDRSKTKIFQMSELGLVEMTRKRTREDLVQYLCEPCPYCQGMGLVKSKRTICYEIIRELEQLQTLAPKIGIKAHPDLIYHMKEKEREVWEQITQQLGKKVEFIPDSHLHLESYEILEIWQE
ncbi:MAG: Rne/Rng family ribonuclease [Candidatus Desulfofervidaceae bacterium]|nr:Rne/Rng family ribonuclease [Candidatus Desulfofervidaceae bacterium]MDL1969570.1 Rne/Rng family ribonuclease [Candidatus Desulfofervidaceae bacterium]